MQPLAATRHGIAWVLPALSCLTLACESRAREVVLCDEQVAPYITDWDGSVWGLRDYAFVRLVTPDASSTKLVEKSCDIAKQPFERTVYPARPAPRSLPAWWDLREGDKTDYATLVRFEGSWVGFVYRRPLDHAQSVEWLMFAGGN